MGGYLECVQMLIETGVHLEAKTSDNETTLELAMKGHKDVLWRIQDETKKQPSSLMVCRVW
jgi:hypothetical protein